MPVSGRNATTKSLEPRSFARRNAPEMHPPRYDEALFVSHLDDVVQNFEIHGGRKKILADAFNHVSLRLDGFAGLDEIVVERAEWIDTDNLDHGIFLFQVF